MTVEIEGSRKISNIMRLMIKIIWTAINYVSVAPLTNLYTNKSIVTKIFCEDFITHYFKTCTSSLRGKEMQGQTPT